MWDNIPFDKAGEVPDDFLVPPDWTIAILSPEQSSNKVIGNILYCLDHRCQLGWLLDPSDRSILVFHPNQPPRLLKNEDSPMILPEIPLNITVATIFGWLKMTR